MIKEIPLHGRAPEAIQSQVHEGNRNKMSLDHDSHASGGCFGMCFLGDWFLGTSLPSVVRAPEKLAHGSQGSRRVWGDRLEQQWVQMFTSLFWCPVGEAF